MTEYTPVKIVRWNVLHLLLMIAGTQGVMLLTSDSQYAQLQGDITLTCNTSDNVSSIEFKRDGTYVGRCSKFGCEIENSSNVIVQNNSEHAEYNIFNLTVKGFEEHDEGYYTCVDALNSSQVSGIQITYLVNITSVTLTPTTDPISVIENVLQRFRCVTSQCRPVASVMWYLGSTQLTSGSESSTSDDVTTSTLDYTPQKSHQGKRILCRGSNGGQQNASDDQTQLNVLYGPSTPVCKLDGTTLSSAVTVKEGWEILLNCSSDGNPSPSFSWTHPGDGPTYPLFIRSINRTHAGKFRIIARNNLNPSEQKAVNLTKDSNVTVDVLYPPDPPSCRVGSNATSANNVSAIRGNTITITCSCDSNPLSINSWSVTGVQTQTSGQHLDLPVQYPTTITFRMENTMHFTNGSTEQGRRESSFEVKVLFPPVVKPLTNVVVLERDNVSVACQVTAGNPTKTDFKWERMSDMTNYSMEQTIVIPNIDRKQGGNYRCTASNLMRPTGYDATVGNSSNTVYIDVQYEAEVTNFTLSNIYHGQPFEVNENTQVRLYCQAQSNPLSNISMLKESTSLKTASNTSDLEFTISKSVCEDEGTYKCTAQNIHNTKADVRNLTLFVRCAPRALALVPRRQNVTSATGVPAVLTLNLVAFPRPRVADFVWEKEVLGLDTWHTVSNGTDIAILFSDNGLQTVLSFMSVKPDHFGNYRVHVNNELGNYTETFRLQAQEHPHSPSNLQNFQKVTVDTIYIEWTPGFDGGLPQKFHVEYREVGASVWRKEVVTSIQSNYTIVGLNEGTMYEIRVYSTNDIGRSYASDAITVSTLKQLESGKSLMVLIILSVGVVCGIVLVVILIVIIKRRKKWKMKEEVDRLAMEHNLQSMSNADGTESDDDEEVINPLYEGGDDIQDEMNKTEALYSKPQKKKVASVSSGAGDIYAVVNKKGKGKQGTKHPSKPKKKSTDNEDVYGNVENPRGADCPTTSHGTYTNGNHDVPLAKNAAKRNVNADGLIYEDVQFPNPQKGQPRFVVRSVDDMTDYASVDLTEKAEPLPESDEDEKSPSK
ncbi:synaptogenesis protein syg-2-like [Mya arenaria]|uniref:synaptogenesis protein syg-2-like n=1 Tax=Mya arenaria TaxID=6604 RepID=UPI0022E35F76|nr:synaptogenesis protein syg-2-like [Mya arenaria]